MCPIMSLSGSGRSGEAKKAVTASSRVGGSASPSLYGLGASTWMLVTPVMGAGCLAGWVPLPEAPVSARSTGHPRRGASAQRKLGAWPA
jgi:hypothetical protein